MGKKAKKKGFSIIDAMIAAMMIIMIVMGTMMYRYHSTLDIRKAEEQLKATQLVIVFCETWRGLGGDESFDPASYFSSEMTITNGSGPSKPADYTMLGSYEITIEDMDCKSTLSYKEVDTGLRALNIIVAWPNGNTGQDKEFEITSYAVN
jgi:hypothetical protein